MFRFFAKEKKENFFILDENTLNHIKVARIKNKEFIIIYNNLFFKCILKDNKAIILEEIKENHEFENEVIIAASLIKTKNFEWLIQKATELGATKLIPIISKNITQKININIEKKVERWNQISKNSSEQSFRNKQMIVTMPKYFEEVICFEIKNKFIAHEKSNNKKIDLYPQDSLFLVGPEGGFTNDEISLAQSKNFKLISLGKRILRAETASIYILSRIK